MAQYSYFDINDTQLRPNPFDEDYFICNDLGRYRVRTINGGGEKLISVLIWNEKYDSFFEKTVATPQWEEALHAMWPGGRGVCKSPDYTISPDIPPFDAYNQVCYSWDDYSPLTEALFESFTPKRICRIVSNLNSGYLFFSDSLKAGKLEKYTLELALVAKNNGQIEAVAFKFNDLVEYTTIPIAYWMDLENDIKTRFRMKMSDTTTADGYQCCVERIRVPDLVASVFFNLERISAEDVPNLLLSETAMAYSPLRTLNVIPQSALDLYGAIPFESAKIRYLKDDYGTYRFVRFYDNHIGSPLRETVLMTTIGSAGFCDSIETTTKWRSSLKAIAPVEGRPDDAGKEVLSGLLSRFVRFVPQARGTGLHFGNTPESPEFSVFVIGDETGEIRHIVFHYPMTKDFAAIAADEWRSIEREIRKKARLQPAPDGYRGYQLFEFTPQADPRKYINGGYSIPELIRNEGRIDSINVIEP